MREPAWNAQYSDWATGWTTGVQFLQEVMVEIFLFATASKLPLGPIQSPIKREPWSLSPGGKAAGA